LTEQLKTALQTNATLVKSLGNTTPKDVVKKPGERKPLDYEAWKKTLDPMGYCWTHGYNVACGHTSLNCTGKLGGQDDTATRADNIKGGSQKGKPRT
jgi:hypothetical protein